MVTVVVVLEVFAFDNIEWHRTGHSIPRYTNHWLQICFTECPLHSLQPAIQTHPISCQTALPSFPVNKPHAIASQSAPPILPPQYTAPCTLLMAGKDRRPRKIHPPHPRPRPSTSTYHSYSRHRVRSRKTDIHDIYTYMCIFKTHLSIMQHTLLPHYHTEYNDIFTLFS